MTSTPKNGFQFPSVVTWLVGLMTACNLIADPAAGAHPPVTGTSLPPPPPPSTAAANELLYLGRNTTRQLSCPIDADPPDTVIFWIKDGHVIESTGRTKISRAGALTIRWASSVDEGVYSCALYSSLGTLQTSTTVRIVVRDPPYFVFRPRPYYQRQPMQTVVMPCEAVGEPTPSVRWRRTDGEFPSITRTLQDAGNLTLARLTPTDAGMYECVASNSVSTIVTSTRLIIEHGPHGAYNVSVTPETTQAKVSWIPAYDGGHALHYVVWYAVASSNSTAADWQTLSVTADDMTSSLTIYGLLPVTDYQFMVSSSRRHVTDWASPTEQDAYYSDVVYAKTTPIDISVTRAFPRGVASSKRPHASSSSPPPTRLANDTASGPGQKGPPTPAAVTHVNRRPSAPYNVSVRWQGENLLISWQPPARSPVPISCYYVEYRTVGQWVPLAQDVAAGNATGSSPSQFLWTTASRSAVYQFRVSSRGASCRTDAKLVLSRPSAPVTFHTKDPLTSESNRISDGALGAIVAVVLVVAVLIVAVSFCGYRYVQRKRDRDKELRYENVNCCSENNGSDKISAKGESRDQMTLEWTPTSSANSNSALLCNQHQTPPAIATSTLDKSSVGGPQSKYRPADRKPETVIIQTEATV